MKVIDMLISSHSLFTKMKAKALKNKEIFKASAKLGHQEGVMKYYTTQ